MPKKRFSRMRKSKRKGGYRPIKKKGTELKLGNEKIEMFYAKVIKNLGHSRFSVVVSINGNSLIKTVSLPKKLRTSRRNEHWITIGDIILVESRCQEIMDAIHKYNVKEVRELYKKGEINEKSFKIEDDETDDYAHIQFEEPEEINLCDV